jgi:hypothetical protein
MAKKPWQSQPGGTQLEAYVGAAGLKTSPFDTAEQLIAAAAHLFDLPPETTCQEMAEAVTEIGRKERVQRSQRNLATLAGRPVSQSIAPDQRSLEAMMQNSQSQMANGAPFGVAGEMDLDPAKLLRRVVSAVIAAGHASDLYEFPDVLAFFGARNPEPSELAGHHNSNPGTKRQEEV